MVTVSFNARLAILMSCFRLDAQNEGSDLVKLLKRKVQSTDTLFNFLKELPQHPTL